MKSQCYASDFLPEDLMSGVKIRKESVNQNGIKLLDFILVIQIKILWCVKSLNKCGD